MVDVGKYQVGTYLSGRFGPDNLACFKAENWLAFDTFSAAFHWLKERTLENPNRIGRMFTYEQIIPEQRRRLGQLGVVWIG